MRDLIDTIFHPVLGWLEGIITNIHRLSVPLSHPIDFGNYAGYFGILGPYWSKFVTTGFALAFIYFVVYLVVSNIGLFAKFKNMIKWW